MVNGEVSESRAGTFVAGNIQLQKKWMLEKHQKLELYR